MLWIIMISRLYIANTHITYVMDYNNEIYITYTHKTLTDLVIKLRMNNMNMYKIIMSFQSTTQIHKIIIIIII